MSVVVIGVRRWMAIKTQSSKHQFLYRNRSYHPSFLEILGVFFVLSVTLAIWPLVMYHVFRDHLSVSARNRPFTVAPSDLIEKTSVRIVEADELVNDPLGAAPHAPFGHRENAWLSFLSHARDGDELWTFGIDAQGLWRYKTRLEGYAIVREGVVRHYFVARRRNVDF